MPLIKNRNDYVLVSTDTHPDIADGEWFKLRRAISWVDAARIADSAMNFSTGNFLDKTNGAGTQKMDIKLSVGEARLARLEAYLLEWSFEEPLTTANIKLLDAKTVNILMRVIDEMEAEQEPVTADPNATD